MIRLSLDQARELAVAAQGLADPPDKPPTHRQMTKMVQRLGCIQLDTIHVVARSHYLTAWSRLGPYDQSRLDDLLYPRRQIFEYWGHAASLISIDLYPYFLRRMARYRREYLDHPEGWGAGNGELVAKVLRAVTDHGPIDSGHFEAPERDEPLKPWAWYGGKPTNEALDVLWMAGTLGIERRINFRRSYDLVERLFPAWSLNDLPTMDEEVRTLALRAALAMGVVAPRWLNDYFRTKWGVRTQEYRDVKPDGVLRCLAEAGHLLPVEIECLGQAYIPVEHTRLLNRMRRGHTARHVTLLSPFDNLIWDRKRTQELFNFTYLTEIYVPQPKRVYGYYTLPILANGRLIGRVDPKADRKARVLILHAIHLEPDAPPVDEVAELLRPALRSFAEFNGCDDILIERAPDGLSELLAD